VALELRMGDVLKLKKAHPCGSDRWQVVRLGADIGLRCLGCGRQVLLDRFYLERRVKAVLSIGQPGSNEGSSDSG